MKTINVTIEGKSYLLDVDKAKNAGALLSAYPLQPGDVYRATSGGGNPFILIQVTCSPVQYQLLGLGANINSNNFFNDVHSLADIETYLGLNNMVYVKNISGAIHAMVNKN